jgi:hypothetical protein
MGRAKLGRRGQGVFIHINFVTSFINYRGVIRLTVLQVLVEQAEWRLERVAGAIREGSNTLEASRAYLGLGGDRQHAALFSEFWRAAAIEPDIRRLLERFVESRLGAISQGAVDRGLAPAAALEFAEAVASFIDASMLYRRVDDAAEQFAGT